MAHNSTTHATFLARLMRDVVRPVWPTDKPGYSRLMHDDEEATHANMTVLLTDAVGPTIAEHGRAHCQEHRRRVLSGVSERG
jgi:hypothetical protein